MKTLYQAVIAGILLLLPATASALSTYNLISGVTSEKGTLAEPIFTVTATDSSYYVTMSLEEIVIEDDDVYVGSKFIQIAGFAQGGEPATPSLPVGKQTFLVPKGTVPIVRPLTGTSKSLANIILAPARQPLLESDETGYTTETVSPVAPVSGLYNGGGIVREVSRYKYRGEEFVQVAISPVSYMYYAQRVKISTRLDFEIVFRPAPAGSPEATESTGIQFANSKNDSFWSTVHTHDRYTEDIFVSQDDDSEEYLIITVPEFQSEAARFSAWKKQEGYHCTIIAEDTWSCESVKQAIHDYASEHPKFTSLLLFGDVNLIPSNPIEAPYFVFENSNFTLKTYYSDWDYACLDGNLDICPDIFYGRIPARSLTDAATTIDKTIQYEKLQASTIGMPSILPPQTALHVAYFQPDPKNYSREGHPFITSSETILTEMAKLNVNIKRCYAKAEESTPTYFLDGNLLPSAILPYNFSWDNTATDIIQTINSGVSYVLYRGHGNYDRWSKPLFTSSDISLLSNSSWHPIVFSMTCLTGRMDTQSLAKRFVLANEAGAVASIGAANTSYSVLNNNLILCIFQNLFQSADFIPIQYRPSTPCNNIGEAFQNGISFMISQSTSDDIISYQKTLYHIFGDPTLKIYTAKPTSIGAVGMSITTGTISVYCNDSNIKITALYRDGSMQSYTSSSATFPYTGCSSLIFTGTNKYVKVIDVNSGTCELDINSKGLTSALLKNGTLTVNYSIPQTAAGGIFLPQGKNGQLTITNQQGRVMGKYTCLGSQTSLSIDVSSYPSDIYIITLVSGSDNLGSLQVIK